MPTLADETIAAMEAAAKAAAEKRKEKEKGAKGKTVVAEVKGVVKWGTSREPKVPSPVDGARDVRGREGLKGPVTS
jgi:hypothetical protein